MNRAAAIALVWLCACSDAPAPLRLADGRVIDSATLERGRDAYRLYCQSCHGERGDGRGPAAPGQRPPPRDFTQAQFKFGGVAAGELPVDEALLRTVRRGLQGTAMQGWDLPEEDRAAVIQYLKTFSPRWRDEPPGTPIEPDGADPWQGREAEAVAKGRAVYHVMAKDHAGCSSCHPAYLTRAELADLTESVTGVRPTAFARDLHHGRLRDTEYGVKAIAPDFLLQPLKTIGPVTAEYSREAQRRDLYRVIAAGVGGTAMPQWKGALPEENLWALAYYVQSLIDLRGTPAALTWREKLDADDRLAVSAGTP